MVLILLLKFRPKILAEMGKRYNIEFTERELREFEKYPSSMGVPILKMKEFLDTRDIKIRKELFRQVFRLIQLIISLLIGYSVLVPLTPMFRHVLKVMHKTGFEIVKKVLDIMADKNVFKFNLITTLEAAKINLADIQK